jgi:hypothetical protein
MFKVVQNEAISKDGTKIPYFIVHPSDMAYDGSNPTLVYGYGGFNSATRPGYSSLTGIGWIEREEFMLLPTFAAAVSLGLNGTIRLFAKRGRMHMMICLQLLRTLSG